jgi:hypothetical protein
MTFFRRIKRGALKSDAAYAAPFAQTKTRGFQAACAPFEAFNDCGFARKNDAEIDK